jgi:DNA-binding beta-propeller fold protein YncE
MKNTENADIQSLSPSLITRRNVLRQAGVAIATGVIASMARAQDAPKIILGEGSHRYECIHDWLVPPSMLLWGDTQGVATDSKENIYISHTVGANSRSKDAILVFNRKGEFVRSFGSQFLGGGHGVDCRKEGKQEFLYHCDTQNRLVVKTDLDGKVLWEKGTPQEAGVYKDGKPFVPTNVAFAPNGDFFIADGYGSSYIHLYDIAGNYKKTFGGRGRGKGELSTPHGLWVDRRGKEPVLVVADRSNVRLQYFNLNGEYIREANEGMRAPCNLDFQKDLTLVPDLNGVVTLLDSKGKVVTHLGDSANIPNLPGRGKVRSEFLPGKFVHPHNARFLKNGDILVVEWLPVGRVTLLKKLA